MGQLQMINQLINQAFEAEMEREKLVANWSESVY